MTRTDPMIEEALRWLVVLQDKGAGEADRRAFDRWLAADTRHEAAWQRAQYVWTRLDTLAPALYTQTRPAARRRQFIYAVAAAVAASSTGVVLTQPGLFADYGTRVGERRSISLQDGSTVELASASSLSADLRADIRRVVLHAGEAFFTVSPDPARPFVVEAAAGRTQALGTAFDVKRHGESVTVGVTRHSVAVSVEGTSRVVVAEGQQVSYERQRLSEVRAVEPGQIAAWRRGRLIFQEAPLGEVIADLERYRGGSIVMTDSRLRAVPVTAVFDTRQADAALDTIAASLPIRVRRVTGLLTILSPKT
jgi:transmembrane sensor